MRDTNNSTRPRRRSWTLSVVAVVGTLGVLGGGVATSSAVAYTVKVGHDYGLNRTIVVSGSGRAVYHRTGERPGHVLCSGLCTQKWSPLTVPSSTTPLARGPGVRGILGKFRRPDGRWQVTLRGLPLYLYSPDHSPGDARGQGEDGVWWTLTP